MKAALEYITEAGLRASIVDGRLKVGPASKLTDEQRAWIRQHKSELLDELKASKPANDPPLLVEAWTPSGIRMVLEANSHEHAAWIRDINPWRPRYLNAVRPALESREPIPPDASCANCRWASPLNTCAVLGRYLEPKPLCGGERWKRAEVQS